MKEYIDLPKLRSAGKVLQPQTFNTPRSLGRYVEYVVNIMYLTPVGELKSDGKEDQPQKSDHAVLNTTGSQRERHKQRVI